MAASPVNRCDALPRIANGMCPELSFLITLRACEGDGGDEAQAARRERWCATALRFNNCVEGAAASKKEGRSCGLRRFGHSLLLQAHDVLSRLFGRALAHGLNDGLIADSAEVADGGLVKQKIIAAPIPVERVYTNAMIDEINQYDRAAVSVAARNFDPNSVK